MAEAGVIEATITFHNEQWKAEGARLLLEVDEGWVGYRDDFAWSWHDETYAVYAATCEERGWTCNSLEASVAMLQALRTGEVCMRLSDSTHSFDGYAQWSLTEMRVLGSQMRSVVDGKSPTSRWSEQLVTFVDTMKTRDDKYAYDDRTVEDFAYRAGKFVPEAILLQIDPKKTNGKVSPKTARTARKTRRASASEPSNRTRRVTRSQSSESFVDSDDEPLARLRKPRTRATRTAVSSPSTTRSERVRKRTLDSDEDSSYHDPTSEDEDLLWEDDTLQHVEPDNSVPATQEVTSQGELLPVQVASNEQPDPSSHALEDHDQPSPPHEETNQQPSFQDDTLDKQPSPANDQSRDSPRDDPPASSPESPREDDLAPQRPFLDQGESVQQRNSPRQDTADQEQQAPGSQHDDTPTRRPTRKHQRVHKPVASDHVGSNGRARSSKAEAPHLFRSLNPYDRPAKPWGEFVVEVLLAERTARNEDELDYVRFVRGLYGI